jgi:DNA-binding transcriptional LysR family regulator
MGISFNDCHIEWLAMRSLDIEAVRAFVMTVDLRSFTRAGAALDTTQSAVSLRIKKLEDALGRRLLERTPRQVRLSADGDAFLPRARLLLAAHQDAIGSFDTERRRLVVGISPHIVGMELPFLLRSMGVVEPSLVLEMRVANSAELLAGFDAGALDAAVVLRHDNRRQDGETLLNETFGWMAAPEFEPRAGEPLRLATQAEPCSVRSMALAALDQAGIAWTEVFVGGGVTTIGAAVSAGLAVAALARRVAPVGTVDVGPELGLPTLPRREVVIYASVNDPQAKNALRTLGAAIHSTASTR